MGLGGAGVGGNLTEQSRPADHTPAHGPCPRSGVALQVSPAEVQVCQLCCCQAVRGVGEQDPSWGAPLSLPAAL